MWSELGRRKNNAEENDIILDLIKLSNPYETCDDFSKVYEICIRRWNKIIETPPLISR
jgi:hypothetical protein